MVRDGRDVALSLARQRWITPLPWDKKRSISIASLFWQHNVSVGNRDGAAIGDKYREVRFEDLVQQPRKTLNQLSDFVGEELDYKHITENPVGSVSKPNSSFGTKDDFSPIGRWHAGMSDEQLASVESLVGQTLIDRGYELSQQYEATTQASLMPAVYKAIWTAKHWTRTQTFIGRLSTLELIRIATTSENDQAATPN